jgi:hypothetical protein
MVQTSPKSELFFNKTDQRTYPPSTYLFKNQYDETISTQNNLKYENFISTLAGKKASCISMLPPLCITAIPLKGKEIDSFAWRFEFSCCRLLFCSWAPPMLSLSSFEWNRNTLCGEFARFFCRKQREKIGRTRS